MSDDPFLASLSATRPARSRDGRNGGRDGADSSSRRGGATRVPPHNLPAEEAVLGAILLSRDALGSVIEAGLRYDDFYKPAHQHIYDVAVAVSQSGGPADTITVADELQRLGLLDAVGGLETLHGLQNATPAISNAGHYAKIVADAAMLRRLIMVAGDISEIAYSGPDNVDQALDEAETKVFKVADRRVSDTYAEIGELMKGAIERIEENYARGDTITGIPTGYQDLDELLSGLQPSTLNIIGARPAMGKALGVSTPLPTPDGWTTMGDVQLGDELLDEHGQRCVVTYATPVQLGNECFEVRFDDGSALVADAEHQWFAFDFPAWKSLRARTNNESATRPYPQLGREQSARRKLPRVVTTRQMLDEGVRAQDERPNWYLQLTAPLDLPDASLPVDPYVFGCWLGTGTAHASMTIGPEDVEHFTAEFEHAGYMLRPAGPMLYRTCPSPGAKVDSDGAHVRSLHAELGELGLPRDAAKHIPQRYLRGSFKQRLALLQGIMDTDGHGRPGQHLVELTFADRGLLEQVHELVCSLGHKAHEIHESAVPLPGGRSATAWRFTWSPLDPVFRMPRKADAVLPPEPGAQRTFTRRAVIAITPIPSVPVRCITVDSPNSLYLAGRTMIPTHNTAFGLGMATNVAKVSGKAVLVFSLEMGHIELTQRILSSEAEVDSTKIRNGKLSENDWARIGRAIGRLEVPLYLDDNPRVTVMEIRAKARRLKMQRGELGLILIDYLQLMSGGGNSENRQLEVSEISRNLKILARELEVPIVALSQLSRNLEARSDKKPMLSDLRESGCLTASTRLLRADTNTEVTLGELMATGALDVPVWSLDEHYRLVPATMTHAFPSGVKRVFRLRLASGRTVDATANHRFRTVDGWTSLDELHVGARLAVPRVLGAPELVASLSPGEIATLADAEHVEPRVFALPTTQVAYYLRRRWDRARRSGGATVAPGRPVSLDCRDGRVAADVQHLLLRLSIRSTVERVTGRGDAGDDEARVRINGLDGHRRFVTEVLQSSATIPDAASDDENDTVPGSVDGRRAESSRGRLAELADVLGDKELADLAASDVLWDRVVGIDEVGVQEVFDATVLSTHNFIANGVVAHNSLEQDADVVMFLYRDEVYNKESPDRGAADLIVAKHRAGPIGDMRLVFRGQYARFDNAAPRAMG